MLDIGSGRGYPASALSNFAGHRFILDGVEIYSLEGFLQSLKCKNPDMQRHLCTLIGRKAKFAGKKKRWWRDGKLYWQGAVIDRFGDEYQVLLDRAYAAAVEQSESFRKALLASGDAVLGHSMGKRDQRKTILTIAEFVGRLNKLREKLREEIL